MAITMTNTPGLNGVSFTNSMVGVLSLSGGFGNIILDRPGNPAMPPANSGKQFIMPITSESNYRNKPMALPDEEAYQVAETDLKIRQLTFNYVYFTLKVVVTRQALEMGVYRNLMDTIKDVLSEHQAQQYAQYTAYILSTGSFALWLPNNLAAPNLIPATQTLRFQDLVSLNGLLEAEGARQFNPTELTANLVLNQKRLIQREGDGNAVGIPGGYKFVGSTECINRLLESQLFTTGITNNSNETFTKFFGKGFVPQIAGMAIHKCNNKVVALNEPGNGLAGANISKTYTVGCDAIMDINPLKVSSDNKLHGVDISVIEGTRMHTDTHADMNTVAIRVGRAPGLGRTESIIVSYFAY